MSLGEGHVQMPRLFHWVSLLPFSALLRLAVPMQPDSAEIRNDTDECTCLFTCCHVLVLHPRHTLSHMILVTSNTVETHLNELSTRHTDFEQTALIQGSLHLSYLCWFQLVY